MKKHIMYLAEKIMHTNAINPIHKNRKFLQWYVLTAKSRVTVIHISYQYRASAAPWKCQSLTHALYCDDYNFVCHWWASSSLIKHQADMKQRAREELDSIRGSKQPDPVWYFPATHIVQLTSSIRPDANVRRGINFDSKQRCTQIPK
jgi:hypothetical protein